MSEWEIDFRVGDKKKKRMKKGGYLLSNIKMVVKTENINSAFKVIALEIYRLNLK